MKPLTGLQPALEHRHVLVAHRPLGPDVLERLPDVPATGRPPPNQSYVRKKKRKGKKRTDDLPDVENLQAVLDLLWQLLDVLPVGRGQQHRFDASRECADEFLLDPA